MQREGHYNPNLRCSIAALTATFQQISTTLGTFGGNVFRTACLSGTTVTEGHMRRRPCVSYRVPLPERSCTRCNPPAGTVTSNPAVIQYGAAHPRSGGHALPPRTCTFLLDQPAGALMEQLKEVELGEASQLGTT